jgi:hypothetical protein
LAAVLAAVVADAVVLAAAAVAADVVADASSTACWKIENNINDGHSNAVPVWVGGDTDEC